MISVIVATIALFLIPFIIAQIRIYKRIKQLRKEFSIPGLLFLSDGIEELASFCGCCYDVTEPRMDLDPNYEYDEEKRKKALDEFQEIKKKEKEPSKTESYFKEKNLVFDIIKQRDKTGLVFIHTRTKIPMVRIIELINENPDYFIENEYVFKKKKFTDDIFEEKTSVLTKKICPTCNTPIEANWDHCSNCGSVLK